MTGTNGFLKGALIGGALAGVVGLLLAPKPGAALLQDILDTYDAAQKNGHDFIETIKEKGACLTHWSEEEECDECDHSFLVGGALGAVIAGIAALLLAPASGKKLRKLLGDQYDDIVEKAEDFTSKVGDKGRHVIDEVNDWRGTLASLVNKLSHSAPKGKHPHHRNGSHVNDILDLAHLGIRLYQQFQKRG